MTRSLLTLTILVCAWPAHAHGQAEPDASRERLNDELTTMELHGPAYNPKGLHELGVDGLVGVLDRFFPETAVVKRELKLPDDELAQLIKDLGSEDFRTRERATDRLIVRGKPSREELLKVIESDDAEVRLRIRRVLAAWEPKADQVGDRSLGGFWNYAEGLRDRQRLDLLARRVIAELDRGWPEGPRLHVLRLCIAGVAKGGDERSCDLLRPLVASKDVRIAKFVTETVGSYKADSRFFPSLLLDALASDREEVAAAAIRWSQDCRHSPQADKVYLALLAILRERDAALKFQVCLPLIQEFDEPSAWSYVIEQTQSKEPLRAASALSTLADAKHSGRSATPELIKALSPHLASPTLSLRWGAVKALGTHSGDDVIDLLLPLLADSQNSVCEEVQRCLLKQPDQQLLHHRLKVAIEGSNDALSTNAAEFLAKLTKM